MCELDNCQVCCGSKGGIKGNENRIDGLIVCDYCSADQSFLTIKKHTRLDMIETIVQQHLFSVSFNMHDAFSFGYHFNTIINLIVNPVDRHSGEINDDFYGLIAPLFGITSLAQLTQWKDMKLKECEQDFFHIIHEDYEYWIRKLNHDTK